MNTYTPINLTGDKEVGISLKFNKLFELIPPGNIALDTADDCCAIAAAVDNAKLLLEE